MIYDYAMVLGKNLALFCSQFHVKLANNVRMFCFFTPKNETAGFMCETG